MIHTFTWGPFVVVVATEGYDLYLHGTRRAVVRPEAGDGSPSLGDLARAALASAEEEARLWGVELPLPLPARARALMRWF